MTPDEFHLPVLIVSQPGSARDTAARVLADMGFSHVMVADNAVRAFAVLTKHRPRLILVDDALRPTSGLVFIRELRATAVASRDAPAVIIAKRSSEVLVQNARKAGADGVIFGSPSAQAIRFWLSCTAPDVRDVIECGGYRGPCRRAAGQAFGPIEEERREPPDALCVLKDQARQRHPIVRRLQAARSGMERWSETGDESLLNVALEAVTQAAAIAHEDGERALATLLDAASLRLSGELKSWDADYIGLSGAMTALQSIVYRHISPPMAGGVA